MKRIIALFLCMLFCLIPVSLSVMAENLLSDVGPCGHNLDYYFFNKGSRTDVIAIGTASQCCYFVYDNAHEECSICGYAMDWPVRDLIITHTWVSSPSCVYCGYTHD